MYYDVTAYHNNGDIAYNVIVDTERQMIQEIYDAMYDGFGVFVYKRETKGDENGIKDSKTKNEQARI